MVFSLSIKIPVIQILNFYNGFVFFFFLNWSQDVHAKFLQEKVKGQE